MKTYRLKPKNPPNATEQMVQMFTQILEEVKTSRQYPLCMTVENVATEMQLSASGAYNLCGRADFPAFKVGGRWVIPTDSFYKWLMQQAANKSQLCEIPQTARRA